MPASPHIRHRPIRKKIADTVEFEIAAHDPYRRWHAGIWQFGQNHSTAAAENLYLLRAVLAR
jgi:hypothetical protein